MVLVQGIDYIADVEEVKRLARNKIPADFSDDQIKSYQQKVYSVIQTMTNKEDWATTDVEYGALQLIEIEVTAAIIQKHYGRTDEERGAAQSIINSTLGQLENFVENIDTVISAEGTITATQFKSWNLNSSVAAPNRLTNVGTGVETKASREIDL
jgi:hypothetical protein